MESKDRYDRKYGKQTGYEWPYYDEFFHMADHSEGNILRVRLGLKFLQGNILGIQLQTSISKKGQAD